MVTDPELSTFGTRLGLGVNVIKPLCPRVSIFPSVVEGNPTVSEVII
jgi:hypothetical protein